jgi:hypothetical protein
LAKDSRTEYLRITVAVAQTHFDWEDAKEREASEPNRASGFEDVVFQIDRGDLLGIPEHSSPDRYAGQRIFVVRREDYVYLVPFVEDEHHGLANRRGRGANSSCG